MTDTLDTEIATVHFNPCRYHRLRETYYEWLPTLGPLAKHVVCLELVFDDDEPEIEGSTVIRGTRDRNLMWQKEPLLNILLRRCTKTHFAFIDHDVYFQSPTWLHDAIARMSDEIHAVQLFREFHRLDYCGRIIQTQRSAVNSKNNMGCPGAAWVAKTEFLRSVGGFPTHRIVGGGDRDMLDRIRDRSVASKTDGYHINHGLKVHRQHDTRWVEVEKHSFDYDKDVRINADGILEFTGNNRPLQKYVREFFEGRREDAR
ncbi:hypothetical protein [Rosistilla oblonga]|uniref:hypothetical protein n=1 Tax=Rosistilla oblonga TaxID=2527990 RepID=UPI003A976A53